MDTLAVRLAVPLTGPAEDFAFLGHFPGVRPAGRTYKKGRDLNMHRAPKSSSADFFLASLLANC